jgi:hypothetical protein
MMLLVRKVDDMEHLIFAAVSKTLLIVFDPVTFSLPLVA